MPLRWRLTGGLGTVRTRFAVASTLAMLLCSVGFVVLIFVGSHSYTSIPSRYGLCLVRRWRPAWPWSPPGGGPGAMP